MGGFIIEQGASVARRRSSNNAGVVCMAGIACLIVAAPVLQFARANIGYLVLGAIGVVALVVGAFIARKLLERKQIHRKQDQLLAVLPFHSMNDKEFEHALAALCRAGGCRDVSVCGGAGDRGGDVIGRTPDGRRLIVQAKRYRHDRAVGDKDMQQFVGGIGTWHEYDLAVLVTTSRFTRPAQQTAQRCGVRLIDNAALAAWKAGTGRPPWA